MNLDGLPGQWFEGTFQEYYWKCVCSEEVSYRAERPIKCYIIRFVAKDMNKSKPNIGGLRSESADHIEDLYLKTEVFKATIFMRMFDDFVNKYTELYK